MKKIRELTDEERELLVREAKKWLGVPYKKYGSDRNGINCSFFGVAVSSMLVNSGTRLSICPPICDWWFINSEVVPRDKLKPGDWVFFRPMTGRPHGRLATHMGIYIGNGRIIHASRHVGKVKYRQLDKIKKMMMIEKKDPEEIRQWRLENGIP